METFSSLVEHLKSRGVLENSNIMRAFTKINRKDFIPKDLQDFAYEDNPLPIDGGQTISQPYTVLFMLNLLDVHKGDKVLDVGSGSGYTTALLSELVGESGHVIGVEIIPELVFIGKENIVIYNFNHTEIHQAKDGVLGVPEEFPYDKILVSATTSEIPKDLIRQLKTGGRMVIPIGHSIWKIEKKSNDNLEIEKYPGFAFVPLIED